MVVFKKSPLFPSLPPSLSFSLTSFFSPFHSILHSQHANEQKDFHVCFYLEPSMYDTSHRSSSLSSVHERFRKVEKWFDKSMSDALGCRTLNENGSYEREKARLDSEFEHCFNQSTHSVANCGKLRVHFIEINGMNSDSSQLYYWLIYSIHFSLNWHWRRTPLPVHRVRDHCVSRTQRECVRFGKSKRLTYALERHHE